jgi:hypothetical protein
MRQRISERRSRVDTAQATGRTCLTCRGEFRPLRPWQIYCSEKCRLTHWAARELERAVREGRADGLHHAIRELVEEARR